MKTKLEVNLSVFVDDAVREVIYIALRETAEQIVDGNTSLIEVGLTPQGDTQKPNSPVWARIKQKSLGHSTSLKAFEEILVNKDMYDIAGFHSGDEIGFHISPPTQRTDAILELREMGYELFEIPKGTDRFLERLIYSRLPKT